MQSRERTNADGSFAISNYDHAEANGLGNAELTAPNPLAGLVCTCRNNCTNTRWGNGPTPCDPNCQPCQIMAGQPYTAPR